jgi:hypothetical protein
MVKGRREDAMHMGKGLSGVLGMLLFTSSVALADSATPRDRAAANADARMEGVIEARLEKEPALVGRGLEARVNGATVTLQGQVKSEQDKQLAARVAHVEGVNNVNNELVVVSDPPAAQAPTPVDTDSPRALSDPHRRDPLVGTMPFEGVPERDKRLRTMGMEDPKLKKAQAGSNTMSPTDAPATGSDNPQTGNQSAPPKRK